jgi:hypothetical protein
MRYTSLDTVFENYIYTSSMESAGSVLVQLATSGRIGHGTVQVVVKVMLFGVRKNGSDVLLDRKIVAQLFNRQAERIGQGGHEEESNRRYEGR